MPKTYTVCFCGTACARDEGEVDRDWDRKFSSKKRIASRAAIFDKDTGYIPVRIHMDISKNVRADTHSVTVRGVGENDWSDQNQRSDKLRTDLIKAPSDLQKYVSSYSDGSNQRGTLAQGTGWSATALALHGANLAFAAVKAGADNINFLGHSRGAVASLMAAWFLYAYGNQYRNVPINIFAIDPVPGTGKWYGVLTQLAPNVHNYVGVYAWDHMNVQLSTADLGFTPVVPRPNSLMTRNEAHRAKEMRLLVGSWKTLADSCQLDDPLAPNKNNLAQPQNYHLYASRGRHSTVAGIITSDGLYDPTKTDPDVAPVPRLIYKLARAYLTQWGTVFQNWCRVRENAKVLRTQIHSAHTHFDAMGSGETRTSRLTGRPYVRRISSIHGVDGTAKYFLEDVVGNPPHRLTYPCTVERKGEGWVKWKFL